MDADELKRLAQDPRFVSGIYNYCDRWCERCPFTRRCLLYATSEERRAGAEERDPSNAAFWEAVHQAFALTRQLISEMATKMGIDLDKVDLEAEGKEEMKRRPKRSPEQRALARQAMRYARMVDAWFDKHEKTFARKQKELRSAARMELPARDPVLEATEITDAIEVIRWYQHQIYVKFKRAGGRLPGADVDPDLRSAQESDSNGSAKVALIGIDRSLAAWGRLYQHLNTRADSILKVLVHLERLRRLGEERYPDARAFHRPGLDD